MKSLITACVVSLTLVVHSQTIIRNAVIYNAVIGPTNAPIGGGGGSPLITSGLVGYWKHDNNSGTTSTDSSGNGNNGTLSGSTTPSWSSPYIGVASLAFNGSTAYVNIPANSILEPASGNFSIMFWLKGTTVGNGMIYSEYVGVNGDYVFMRVNGSGTVDAVFQGQHGGPSGALSTTVVTDGSWHLIVAVFTSGVTSIYTDGVLENTSVDTTGVPVSPGLAVNIGTFQNGSGQFYTGNIDEVGLYNRALTGTEITSLKNQTHP